MAEPPPSLPSTAPAAPGTVQVVAARAAALDAELGTTPGAPPTEVVDGVLAVVAAESASLLDAALRATGPATVTTRERLAELNVRAALASWDVLARPDEAARLLELADGHPLAPRLRLQTAIATGELADLDRKPRLTAARGSGLDELALDTAEVWLWRYADPARAAVLAERVLGRPDRSIAARDAAVELAALAHAAAGNWARVVALRRGTLDPTAPLYRVAATAALVLDRGDDAAAALDACAAAAARDDDPDPLARLRVLDVGAEAAARLGDRRRVDLLDRRAALIATLPGGALDALATRHVHGHELARHGDHAGAAATLAALADEPANQLGRAGARIALVGAVAAAAGGDRRAALALHRRLADSECVAVAATHAWRALELAAALGEPTTALAAALADLAGPAVDAAALAVHDLAALDAKAVSRLAARGGPLLRAAALVAERLGDRSAARELWREAASTAERCGVELDHALRLARPDHATGGADLDTLAELYRLAAEREPAATAAALWCARGLVALASRDAATADDALRRAAALDPTDACSRAAHVALLRSLGRSDGLAAALADLAATLTSHDARAAAARERAEVLAELGDPTAARELLERAIADRPDDDTAVLALADLVETAGELDRAIELRLRAVNAAPPGRRAEIWLAIARGQDRRGDANAALAALDRAIDLINSGNAATTTAIRMTALAIQREQVRLLRATGKPERAVAATRRALALDPPPPHRGELQLELAELLGQLGREPEAVVAAYLDILAAAPDHATALAGIVAPARALKMWDALARAFRAAPRTAANLEVLADALAHVSAWAELVDVRRELVELADAPADKARHAGELAALYACELGDVDAALRTYADAQALHHDAARFRPLAKLLRDNLRWAELAAAIERELAADPAAPTQLQVDLLHELGDVLAHKLERPIDAAVAYEAILARRPDDGVAATALERLYAALGRDDDLATILEARAEATRDPMARAALFAKVAGMRTRRGEIDAAIAAYAAAFRANPDSRDTFTAMERVCYKAERWAEAMDLYAIAIGHVEGAGSRAYRLGDLYARRANVQRTFLGDVDAALLSYQKVVEVDSQPTTAARNLDELCTARGDWLPLIVAWERRADTQRDPQRKLDALRAALQVLADHSTGDVKVSARLQRRLLALDPGDADVAAALERFYESHTDPTGLIEVLRARLASAITPDDTVALLKRIARVSEEGGRDVVTATEHYRKVLDIQKDNREALDALARIYESTEQWAEYLEVTRELIKVTTDRTTKALLFFRCGSVMEAKFGREADAIRYYHHAIKTAPSCMPAVHGLRDLYRRREDWHRVIETLELEVKLWVDDKERAGVLAQIGRIYDKQLGDPARALVLYQSALAADAECLPANQAMFDVHFERGEWASALPLGRGLARAMEREGDPASRSEFFRRVGVAAARSGEYRYAADCIRAALEQRPTNAAALDELGAIARAQPDAYDFATIYQALEKDYRKRDDSNPLLARVLIARAATAERAGDLDQAAALYAGAIELAPADLGVLSARVDFDVATRAWPAAIAAIERFVTTPQTALADRVVARLRQAQIHGDCATDHHRAIGALDDAIRMDPSHPDAQYRLAGELVAIESWDGALAAIERAIELAGAPGQPLSPAALARGYYYKGYILDRMGDARASAQYRRAIDYDPGYAPAAVVLAQRLAATGDVRGAEALLIETAHAAIAAGGPRAAVPLQRGLARILLASGERAAAIEAYRGILAVDPDGVADRLALADIYASDDRPRAIAELRRVIDRDVRRPAAYRGLAEQYTASAAPVRAYRVLVAAELLGYASTADRDALAAARATLPVAAPITRTLDADTRARVVVAPAAHDALGDVFAALAEDITATIGAPPLGAALQPLATVAPAVARIAAELAAVMQCDAELFVGDAVPGLVVATAFPRRVIVLDRALLTLEEPSLRFVLGYHFDAVRAGYACLIALGARQRRDAIQLLRGLVGPADERAGLAAELVERASPRARKVVDKLANTHEPDAGAWIDAMLATAERAGLIACDDLPAANRALAELTGALLPSADLVRFYVGDGYAQLRELLVS